MQIKDLPSSSTLASTDVLAKDTSGGTTQKISGADLASQVKLLGSLLGTSDVVDSLSSTATDKPLSANQGKVLNERFSMYGTIPDGTDLDTLTEPGKCGYLSINSTYAHHPNSGVATELFVINHGRTATMYITQIAIQVDAIFIRRKFVSYGATWSAWQMFQMAGCGWQASGTNIDNLTKPGTYGLSSGNTYSGTFPSGVSSGILEVIAPAPATTYVFQRLSGNGVIYTRYRSASTGTAWGSWYKFTGTSA